jgi:hypothetical protein
MQAMTHSHAPRALLILLDAKLMRRLVYFPSVVLVLETSEPV